MHLDQNKERRSAGSSLSLLYNCRSKCAAYYMLIKVRIKDGCGGMMSWCVSSGNARLFGSDRRQVDGH